MAPAENGTKEHTACDECRFRKLKCSSGRPSCERCVVEGIACVYSVRKSMGRPRKRQRVDDGVGIVIQETAESTSGLANSTSDGSSAWSGVDEGHQPGRAVSTIEDLPVQLDDMPFSPTLLMYGVATPGLMNHPIGNPDSLPSPPEMALRQGTPTPACACLSILYLTLSNLHAIKSFAFPFCLAPLRSAMNTASEVLHCQECPKEQATAMQNTALANTLLMAIAERFHKVLAALDAENQNLKAQHRFKTMQLGDMSPETRHLHTGNFDCPGSLSVDLEPDDWLRLAKNATKNEVKTHVSKITLEGLVTGLEERQKRWHSDPKKADQASILFGHPVQFAAGGEKDYLCLQLTKHVRVLIDSLKLN